MGLEQGPGGEAEQEPQTPIEAHREWYANVASDLLFQPGALQLQPFLPTRKDYKAVAELYETSGELPDLAETGRQMGIEPPILAAYLFGSRQDLAWAEKIAFSQKTNEAGRGKE